MSRTERTSEPRVVPDSWTKKNHDPEPDTDEATARWYAVLAERVSYDGRTSLRRYIRVTYAREDALRVFDVAYPEIASGGGVVPHPSHYRASIVDGLERAIDRLLSELYDLEPEIAPEPRELEEEVV